MFKPSGSTEHDEGPRITRDVMLRCASILEMFAGEDNAQAKLIRDTIAADDSEESLVSVRKFYILACEVVPNWLAGCPGFEPVTMAPLELNERSRPIAEVLTAFAEGWPINVETFEAATRVNPAVVRILGG